MDHNRASPISSISFSRNAASPRPRLRSQTTTVLPSLTHETLKELGVTAVGHRLKLLDAIAGLRTDAGAKRLSAETAPPSTVSSISPEDRADDTSVVLKGVAPNQLTAKDFIAPPQLNW